MIRYLSELIGIDFMERMFFSGFFSDSLVKAQDEAAAKIIQRLKSANDMADLWAGDKVFIDVMEVIRITDEAAKEEIKTWDYKLHATYVAWVTDIDEYNPKIASVVRNGKRMSPWVANEIDMSGQRMEIPALIEAIAIDMFSSIIFTQVMNELGDLIKYDDDKKPDKFFQAFLDTVEEWAPVYQRLADS